MHERNEAGEERRVRLHGQGLVRVVAVLVEDGAKLLTKSNPRSNNVFTWAECRQLCR